MALLVLLGGCARSQCCQPFPYDGLRPAELHADKLISSAPFAPPEIAIESTNGYYYGQVRAGQDMASVQMHFEKNGAFSISCMEVSGVGMVASKYQRYSSGMVETMDSSSIKFCEKSRWGIPVADRAVIAVRELDGSISLPMSWEDAPKERVFGGRIDRSGVAKLERLTDNNSRLNLVVVLRFSETPSAEASRSVGDILNGAQAPSFYDPLFTLCLWVAEAAAQDVRKIISESPDLKPFLVRED